MLPNAKRFRTKIEQTAKLSVIIVCVNYSDYLSVTLRHNIKNINPSDINVVTSNEDTNTKKLVSSIGAKIIIADKIECHGYKFNHAHLINYGLNKARPAEWVLLLDADTIVADKVGLDHLNKDEFYGCERFLIENELQAYDRKFYKESASDNFPSGFFQLFHVKSKPYASGVRYDEACGIGGCDISFANKWQKINKLETLCLHIGKTGINWHGRVSEPLA